MSTKRTKTKGPTEAELRTLLSRPGVEVTFTPGRART